MTFRERWDKAKANYDPDAYQLHESPDQCPNRPRGHCHIHQPVATAAGIILQCMYCGAQRTKRELFSGPLQ